MRVSLEKKIEYIVSQGFDMSFTSIPENRKWKQYFWRFDNWEYMLPIVWKDFKDVVSEAYKSTIEH